MADFSKEDEELIQRFIGLQTSDTHSLPIALPASATSSCDWSLCLLEKVISNRTALESHFQMAMKNAWDAQPGTEFSSVAKNCFLIQFCDENDRITALSGGPWTFRGDLVAFAQVTSQLDLTPSHIGHANLCVQLFNIPVNAFTEEGLLRIGNEVGNPISAPLEGFVGGRRFYKIRIRVDLTKPLRDKVVVNHPVLGDVCAYCVYEKVSRICIFCGHLGHDLASCSNYTRLSSIMQSPAGQARASGHNILTPIKGRWMTDCTLIPRDQMGHAKVGSKRAHVHTKPGPTNANHLSPEKQQQTTEPSHLVHFLGDSPPQNVASSPTKAKRPRPAGPNLLAHFL